LDTPPRRAVGKPYAGIYAQDNMRKVITIE